jgi:metal-responsive CopG/Arc/MetJ family transcriptional regulator
MTDAELKNVSLQIERDLLHQVDRRAQELDLNRSQYIRRLMRRDLGVRQAELPPVPTLAPAAKEGVAA